jgi:hypothetical protein
MSMRGASLKYTDFILLATEARIVKAEGKKRLTFSLLAPGILNDPVPCEHDARAVDDLREKAARTDAEWKDAWQLGERWRQRCFLSVCGMLWTIRLRKRELLRRLCGLG